MRLAVLQPCLGWQGAGCTVLSPSVVRVPLEPHLPVSFGTQCLALVHVEVQNQRVDLG
jgi:hypothetical protein